MKPVKEKKENSLSLKELIDGVFNDGLPYETIKSIALEEERRQVRVTTIPVIDYTPPTDNPEYQIALPGTITVYLLKKGDPIIESFQKLSANSLANHKKISEWMRTSHSPKKPLTISKATELLIKSPVFAEVRYGNKTMAKNLFIPQANNHCSMIFPYNGGQLLKDEGLFLVETYQNNLKDQLVGIAIKHDPKLTAAELTAIKALRESMLDINMGISLTYALTGIAVAAVVTLAASVCFCNLTLNEPHVTDEDIEKLGPFSTAQEIITIRREALLRLR